MAAIQAASVQVLTHQIHHHLDVDMPESANFLAGRLHALDPRSPESAHLLALTYLRLRRFRAARDASHKYGSNGRHVGCAYVYAQACLHLKKIPEGTAALEKCLHSWDVKTPKHQPRFRPDAAACWTLLGRLYQGCTDLQHASEYWLKAHKANPFTWEAFECLCRNGADMNLQYMFKPTTEMVPEGVSLTKTASQDQIYTDDVLATSQPLAPQPNFNQQVFTPSADPFGAPTKSRPPFKQPLSEWDTPVANGGNVHEDADDETMSGTFAESEGVVIQPPPAPTRRARPGQQHFEPPDRPRQPALRGHVASTSEGQDEIATATQYQRKPSMATLGGHKRTVSGHQTASTADTASTVHPSVRRSNRLFGQSTTTSSGVRPTTASSRTATGDTNVSAAAGVRPAKPATGTKGRVQSTVGRVVSGNRKVLPPDRNKDEKERRVPSRTGERDRTATIISVQASEPRAVSQTKPPTTTAAQQPNVAQTDYAALTNVLDNLRILGSAAHSLALYDTSAAIRILRALPAVQRETPFVLASLGKAHYESGDYKAAEESFSRLLKLQPSRTQDIEVYSTVLWHLKKDAQLAFLCHTLRDNDPSAPETWCAVGNAFSLSREHDSAIAAFKRAVQVDRGFGYAWTLMGHEYIANEDFESAILAFRHATSCDRRAYGGWYGLGKCDERMGRLEMAEKHYRIASSLNPNNSTLLVCIGLVLEKLKKREAALAHYTKALESAPGSALARFKKARVLLHLREYEAAVAELEVLREQAPEEANVWFLLGKGYKGLGRRGEGLRCFTNALNLDGKAAPLIKEAMEALDEEDEDEGSDDD